jgi:AcrR family transcriptional regulator
MVRRKKAETAPRTLLPAKERIIMMAERLFGHHGIHLPLATIANAAHTNVDTILKYYGSWDGLVIAFLRSYATTIDLRWKEEEEEHPGDPAAQVHSWLEKEEGLASDSEFSCFELFRAAAFVRPHQHSRVSDYIRVLKLKELYKLAAKCEAAGFFEPEALAMKLMLLVNGAMAGNLLFGENGPAVELVKAAEPIMASHRAPPAAASAVSRGLPHV